MDLCNDCVAREQCGNKNVVGCISYVKEMPLRWETEGERIRNMDDDALAEYLSSVARNAYYDGVCNIGKDKADTDTTSTLYWKQKLNQPAFEPPPLL